MERLCRLCNGSYNRKLGHVKTYHKNDAYDLFASKNTRTIIEDVPRKHVALKHRERAFKELAETLD
jgi:hypothetical protein